MPKPKPKPRSKLPPSLIHTNIVIPRTVLERFNALKVLWACDTQGEAFTLLVNAAWDRHRGDVASYLKGAKLLAKLARTKEK